MKLVHFRKINTLQDCRHKGIPMQRKDRRLSGVYAAPLLNFPRSVTNNWKRELSRTRQIRLGGIVFEIPDNELVYFASDWTKTALGPRLVVSARFAERLTIEAGLESLRPLDSIDLDTELSKAGEYGSPCYDYGLLEVIVPRSIHPDEIIRIEHPGGAKKPRFKFDSRSEEVDCEIQAAPFGAA